MKKLIFAAFAVLIANSALSSDILTMLDGKMYQVDVIRVKSCELTVKIENEKFVIPATEIQSIEFENVNDPEYLDFIKMNQFGGDACLSGQQDAENFHGKKGGHIALGVLFGPFAILGTALFADPDPSKGAKTASMSTNKQMFSDPAYLQCYKKEAKSGLIKAEAIGWAAWLIFLLL